jgi:hypothetical protein
MRVAMSASSRDNHQVGGCSAWARGAALLLVAVVSPISTTKQARAEQFSVKCTGGYTFVYYVTFDTERKRAVYEEEGQSRLRKSAQGDRWSFCLTAGTLCRANQETP